MNRNYARVWGLQKEAVLLEGSFTIGSTGAVGTVLGLGIKDVVRSAQGAYTIKLDDNYNRFLGLDTKFSSTMVHSGIFDTQIDSNYEQIDVRAASAPVVKFKCFNASGSATDPASGTKCYFKIMLRRSSVGQSGE